MAKCFLHPGRDSVINVAAKNYCQQCKDGQQAAAAQVAQKNKHVEPKACFVTYKGGDSWLPFLGTGCAHWVAHQLDISSGAPSNQCLEGHSIRVPDVIQGKQKISIGDVVVNDIWANDALTHMGARFRKTLALMVAPMLAGTVALMLVLKLEPRKSRSLTTPADRVASPQTISAPISMARVVFIGESVGCFYDVKLRST